MSRQTRLTLIIFLFVVLAMMLACTGSETINPMHKITDLMLATPIP